MKKFIHLTLAAMAILVAFTISSCEKVENSNATLQLMLTDAPALYDEVNVDIQEIHIHNDEEGWIKFILDNPGVYNLLEFSNGLDTLLGTMEVPAGKISQIRFVLGENNSIVVDSVSYPVTVPSSSTSGLKFNVHADLESGYTYKFWIDFDAAHSIIKTGNGQYKLKPVIRMFTEATTGAIDGNVLPAEALPLVKVFNETGYFMIKGLAAGVYTVDVTSESTDPLYNSLSIEDVTVVVGQTTQLELITLIIK
jgi:hypothetical protein